MKVAGHAAPAAGVLCSELIASDAVMIAANCSYLAGTPLTRSAIIQQLSVLVSFLDWIGPSQPNSDLAAAAKKTIQHVLDLILNHGTVGPISDFGFDPGMDDLYGLDLLDTFDWFRGDNNSTGTTLHTHWSVK